ncbi:MAG TPA: LacI family DNA-binding transcriptional regulator [Pyrinomonadaceae bacterium]|nr:LacI family DNA-binding transcriptional regulator [Pyrinomonadaceae bacterium]
MRIKDVAREAGVSTATVSHVINETRYVSEATRSKVLRAIEQCNYYPNAHARSLASGRSQMIGLIVSDISNPFFPDLVKSIEASAFDRGYDVVLSNTSYDSKRASSYVRRILERKVAGVALMTSELDAGLLDELSRRHVSVVLLDLGVAGERMSTLVVDYQVGIDEAIRYLVGLGHRRLAYVGGPHRMSSALKRLEGFRESVARTLPGELPPLIYEGDFRLESGRRAAREIIAAAPRPTAVVVANDMMALGVMQECRRADLHIPRDISIVGFDDIAFAALAEPPLTTVCLPRAELGKRAVEALIAMIERPGQPGVEVSIPTYLITRGSTGPANGIETAR